MRTLRLLILTALLPGCGQPGSPVGTQPSMAETTRHGDNEELPGSAGGGGGGGVPFPGHGGVRVASADFSPDRKWLLTGYSGGLWGTTLDFITLWDVATGQKIRSWMGHASDVTHVAFLPDGKLALSVGQENNSPQIQTCKLWDVTTGKEVRTIARLVKKEWSPVALSPDGRLGLGSQYNQAEGTTDLLLWDVTTGKELKTLEYNLSKADCIFFSPSGEYALTGHLRGPPGAPVIYLWDVKKAKLIESFDAEEGWWVPLGFIPDGKNALLEKKNAQAEYQFVIWDVVARKEVRSFPAKPAYHPLCITPDGKHLLCSGPNQGIAVWDMSLDVWDLLEGRQVRTIPLGKGWELITFSREGKLAFAVGGDADRWTGPEMEIVDVASGKVLQKWIRVQR